MNAEEEIREVEQMFHLLVEVLIYNYLKTKHISGQIYFIEQ